MKFAGAFTVLSPFWSVMVAVAVPDGAWQVERNSPSVPPVSVTPRLVSGMSGRPVNVAEFLTRLTEPASVSGNGDGNTSVSDNPLEEPVRYALPESVVGYSGDVALAEPTVGQLPDARFRHRALIDCRFGASVEVGNASDTDLLGAWDAVWVMVVASLTCRSLLSRAALTLKTGE